jgi:hypothetical protein
MVSVVLGNTASIGGVTSGLFMNTAGFGGVSGNAVRNLQIVCSPAVGQAISLGGVLDMTVDTVKAIGGFNAVGNWVMYANYVVHVRHCFLQAYDSPYFAYQQLSVGDDNYFGTAGRVTIRLVGGNADWQNSLVAFAETNSECIVKIRTALYGGNFHFANMNVDFEGGVLSQAGIYCENIATAPATSLMLRDIFFGSIGPNASLIQLRDLSAGGAGSPYHRCLLSAKNVQAFTYTYKAAVDVDGPLWHGDVDGLPFFGPQFVHRGTWGPKTSVVVRDTKFTGTPREFGWYSGAHVLDVRSPADGQFSEWRCVTTGAYGTPKPPAWYGMNPINASPNGMAAYVLNHAYITAALS